MTEVLLGTVLPPLGRGLLLAGILLLGGAVAWRFLIAPGAARLLAEAGNGGGGEGGGTPGENPLAPLSPRVARVAALTALALLPVWGLRLHAQLEGFRDPFAPLMEDLSFLVLETFWGWSWMAQGALLVLLAAGFALVARGERARPPVIGPRAVPGDPDPGTPISPGWKVLGVGVLFLVTTLALQSHAMGVPTNRWLAVALDGAHTLAGGAWIGSLALLLGVGRGAGPQAFAAQLRGFSPVAMVSVGVLVFAGFLLSTQHVVTWENLWISPYGRVLSLKVAVALGVMAVGGINWRRGLPVAHTPEGAAALRRRGWVEVGLACVVLALTAVLTGMPMPEDTH